MIRSFDQEQYRHLPPSHPLTNRGVQAHIHRPRLRVSERRLLLLIADLILINGALVMSLQWRAGYPTSPAFYGAVSKWFFTLTILWLGVAVFFDVYNLPRASNLPETFRATGGAVLVTVLLYTFIPVVTPPLQSRGQLFLFWGAALIGVLAWRGFYAGILGQPWYIQRALLVGAGASGRELAMALRERVETPNPFKATGTQVVAFIDPNPAYVGRTVYGIPVLGGYTELTDVAQTLDTDEVVLVQDGNVPLSDAMVDAVLRCSELGMHVCSLAELYERILGRVPVLLVGNNLANVLDTRENPGERLTLAAKRLIDLMAGGLGLLVVALLAPLFWIINRVTSPGPLFYRQQRVGRAGESFLIFKFRTMIPDAEQQSGAVWSQENDPRVTPLGRWLRRLRLDELPQCLNMVRGEMSLVGPRPERPEFVDQLVIEVPFYRARHAVKPGLTGWAQVHYSYGNSVDDARIKLEYDLYYVKHLSLFLDLRILVRTANVVLRMKGL